MSQYYTPDRIVVAGNHCFVSLPYPHLGVGVEHSELVDLASDMFNASQTIWAREPSLIFDKLPPVDHSRKSSLNSLLLSV